MAILLRFNLFVARKSSIEAKYPGGLEQFRADWMNDRPGEKPNGEDGHLVGCCTMGWYYADVMEKLIACGLENQRDDRVIDIAFGDQMHGVENRLRLAGGR